MAQEKDPRQVYLKGVRLSYPHLLEKQKANEDAEPKYSCAFIIDPTTKDGKRNIRLIEKALDEACQQEFKKPFAKMKFKDDRVCYFSGDDVFDANGDPKDGYEGMMIIKASNKRRVDLRNRDKSPIDPEDSPFYGGCFGEAILRLYGTKKGGSPGLFASLELVRFVEHGESFGAPPVDDSILDDLDDDEDDEDDDDDDMLD
jgi:hypothetical protein